MRSTEEMKALVRRDAATRRNRRRALVGCAAAAVVVLLVGVAATRPGPGAPTEVSTASDDAVARSVPTPVGVTSTVPGDPNPPTAEPPDSGAPGVTVPAGESEVVPTTGRLVPTETTSPSVPTDASDASDVDPQLPGAPATTTTTSLPASTTTSVDVAVCEDADTFKVPVGMMVYAGDPAILGPDLPASGFGVFHYSAGTRPDGAACRTSNSLHDLTITDQDGQLVYHLVRDEGSTRVVPPGDWVVFGYGLPWSPRCQPTEPPYPTSPADVRTCVPVGPGTYTVTVRSLGLNFDPVTVTVIADG